MLFSSMSFIFVFLPIVCGVYFLSRKEYRNLVLFTSSIIFYAWGEYRYLPVILSIILINWLGAFLIDKYRNKVFLSKICLITTIVLNLGNLIYFKYFSFLTENLNRLFQTHYNFVEVALPLGISFYTFQAMSYLIDVYRNDCKVQKNIYKLALYICLFPQLVSGPIIKYHDIEPQLDTREVNIEKVAKGVKRFIIGLSKKVLIADTMGIIADVIFKQDPSTFPCYIGWLGAASYSFQIFFDFSGYSDMAIGLGQIFGFKFMENFNYPYISKSITEFWRRWHISLSTWFKQYVYIPLGGNKEGKLKQYRNLGIVFLLTGLWHGAAWNFIIWGIWHGFFIIVEKMTGLCNEFQNKFLNFAKHAYCIFVFVIGFVIFRSDNMNYAFNYLMNMFGQLQLKPEEFLYAFPYYVDRYESIIFVFAVICCIPLFKNILEVKNVIAKIAVNIWLLFLFVLSVSTIAANTYNPFIYFKF